VPSSAKEIKDSKLSMELGSNMAVEPLAVKLVSASSPSLSLDLLILISILGTAVEV
jgi:hypothetical protein